ncbi:ArsR family transcriptional regulator [Aquibacillus albus]|uniref:ArsR family transcriptional regulator n=1 Tax=Aquibacillus albus TaxID=1168171 RepID=A0ABS2N516_9BACI|nr:ArsR family transcriptional regulator [Aquibacillus albus]
MKNVVNKMKEQEAYLEQLFEKYEIKFKAVADKQRLQIMHVLTTNGSMSVGDLMPKMDMAQSKLSYHLKILLDADLILKETQGTWSYYSININSVNHLLSEELCCLFRPANK